MSAAQFTPGPWVVHPVQKWVSPLRDIDTPVCALRSATRGVDVDENVTYADACLIAAAPELLEALDLCRAVIKFSCRAEACVRMTGGKVVSAAEALEAAVAAIDKATGAP